MADTAVALAELNINAVTTDPAGTSVSAGDTAVITPVKARKLAFRVTSTATCTLTVKAGDNPPSHSAAYGDLTLTIGNATKMFVLEPARYLQDDGTIRIVVNTTAATVRAITLPNAL